MTLCDVSGCGIYATYGRMSRKATRCAAHKDPDMTDVKSCKCREDGCSSQPVFGLLSGKPLYCVHHKTAEMVDVKNKKCLFAECLKQPSYDIKGGKGVYCVAHKLPGMVDVRHKTCINSDCKTRATYGFTDENATRCFTHRLGGMVLSGKHLPCVYPECTIKHATYDISGGAGRFCFSHKMPGMIKVRNKRVCNFSGCTTRATFNVPTSTGGIFCSTHKKTGMVDVTSPHCSSSGCFKQSTFRDTITGKKYCKDHRTPSNTIFRRNMCKIHGCEISARFNNIGNKRGEYCFSHKLTGMIDVATIRCLECSTIASYGVPGTRRTHCTRHRKPGMIQRPSHTCKVKGCSCPAIYGNLRIALHCELHRDDTEINLVERPCTSCNLPMVLNKDSFCEYCVPGVHNSVRLEKQRALFEYLDGCKFLPSATTTDKIIASACGKERPDRSYECTDKVIIIECDEHQHRDRLPECELIRMKNIGQMYGGTPVYFLRWNPDNYAPQNPLKMTELIKPRYKLLAGIVKDLLENRTALPKCLVGALYLYYDGWDGISTAEWNIITSVE
jgi:hypothetical protein